MELDELKRKWVEYDHKLTRNLTLNEELMKKINLTNSKRELQKPLVYEIGGVVLMFFLTVFVFGFTVRLIAEPKFSIPGFFAVILALAYLLLAVLKVNRFASIDYFNSSVLKLQKDLASLTRMVIVFRKWEFIMMPLFFVTVLPVLVKGLHDKDIFENMWVFVGIIAFMLVVSISASIWINKNVYDKKLQNANKFFAELEKYEIEDESQE